jgi:hypothetical protein
MRDIIASVLDIVSDPHAFATAYVNHVAVTGEKPSLANAAYLFETTGKVSS